jgi:hypothetical protein
MVAPSCEADYRMRGILIPPKDHSIAWIKYGMRVTVVHMIKL